MTQFDQMAAVRTFVAVVVLCVGAMIMLTVIMPTMVVFTVTCLLAVTARECAESDNGRGQRNESNDGSHNASLHLVREPRVQWRGDKPHGSLCVFIGLG